MSIWVWVFGIWVFVVWVFVIPKRRSRKIRPLEVNKKGLISSQSYHMRWVMVTQCSQAATARKNRDIYRCRVWWIQNWLQFEQHYSDSVGAFHLIKNSENSGLVLNGKRFFGSPYWKIPRKSGTAQKVVPFSRLERLSGNLCSIYRISRLYRQFHAFCGLLSGQASVGSLVFPKNGGWSGSGFWNRFANKLQGYYQCSACHVLAPDHGNLLQHECALYKSGR